MTQTYWIYLFYFLLGALLFFGAKRFPRGEWNDGYTSLAQTKVLLGVMALGVALHHMAQKTCAPWHPSRYTVHGLDPFVQMGYLFVGAFLFCSGLGLYRSVKSKPDYLRTFVRRRILPVVIAYYLSEWLCTGVRRSEALQRLKSDVDMKAWELRIPKAKTPDGVRTVPIIQPLREPLKTWMDAHPGKWLFPYIPYNGRKGEYMTDSNWETAWAKFSTSHGWVDEDGKPVYGAHNLRHGTATLLYEAGVDVYTAQHILGHANVTTTLEIYTELRKKHETKNVKKFSRKLSTMLSKRK